MDDDFPPDEPSLDRWSIPIHDPEQPPLPPTSPSPVVDDAGDVLHFPISTEPPPAEGYHPRLFRFGDVA